MDSTMTEEELRRIVRSEVRRELMLIRFGREHFPDIEKKQDTELLDSIRHEILARGG